MTSSDWIALGSAFVAICALAVSLWQGYVTREHSILSVAPRLDVHVHISEIDGCFIDIKNAGLGPAFIKKIDIETPSKIIQISGKTDWTRVFKELWREIPDCNAGYLAPGNETILAADAVKRLLILQKSDNQTELRDAFRTCIQRTRLVVKYQCIYKRNYEEIFDGERSAT